MWSRDEIDFNICCILERSGYNWLRIIASSEVNTLEEVFSGFIIVR